MTPLYIIPARGGSKGIPRKNIKQLGGRPLIAYTIDTAKEAQCVTGGYILLSTDDKEIAEAGMPLWIGGRVHASGRTCRRYYGFARGDS